MRLLRLYEIRNNYTKKENRQFSQENTRMIEAAIYTFTRLIIKT